MSGSRIAPMLLMSNVPLSRSRSRSESRSSLLTSANADTRGRAVNGPHASVSLPARPPHRDAGKDQARSRWLG